MLDAWSVRLVTTCLFAGVVLPDVLTMVPSWLVLSLGNTTDEDASTWVDETTVADVDGVTVIDPDGLTAPVESKAVVGWLKLVVVVSKSTTELLELLSLLNILLNSALRAGTSDGTGSIIAVLSESGIDFSAHTINPRAIPRRTICNTRNGHVKAVGL